MSEKAKTKKYKTLDNLVVRFRDDLNDHQFVLLYAYNGTGKTRLSMTFKDKIKKGADRDTLYFNAYTEDLFRWDNDLENDKERVLTLNVGSNFFNGFKELALEDKIFAYLTRYADFDFKIDYEKWTIVFSRGEVSHIKISRGEENIFIWCIFLAICELTIDGAESYKKIKYFYIDDPISSLDDNNAIAVASDLAKLLRRGADAKIKAVLSSHHTLFFNVICNELKKYKHTRYFLYKNGTEGYGLQKTDETPFFHHVAMLSQIQAATQTGKIYTYHFNMLRSILEKTATFFGFDDFSKCIINIEDEVLYSRALNLLSHGKYSVYEPVEMGEDNKKLFKRIFQAFIDKYQFDLPDLFTTETT